MQWDKGTETLLNGWLQSQQKLWGNWWEMVAGSTQNGHPGVGSSPAMNGHNAMPFNPFVELWTGMAARWQTYLQQSMSAYAPQMNETARLGMEQFMASQNHSQQLLRMTTEAWQAVMSTATSPAEWQPALNSYLERMRQQLMSGFNSPQMVQNGTELWQIYLAEMQRLTQPWLNLWVQGGQLGVATGQRNSSSAMVDLTNLYWDAFNQTLGRMANLPSMGLMRELNEKINRGFVDWQANQRVNAEYQQLLANTMVDAFAAFMQKLLEMAQAGKAIESQSKLLTLWVEVADEEFLQLFHSQHYADVQSRYVNTSMALRRQQSELVEVLLRMNNLPTKSALDEAHHNIFLLRKEVKALQKAVHALQSAPAGETAPAVAKVASQPASAPKKTKATKATSSRKAKAAPVTSEAPVETAAVTSEEGA